MTRDEAEAKARSDYQAALGSVIDARWVYGYRGEDSVEIYCDPPARVRVVATLDGDVCHWNDLWLDPYWDVEADGSDSRLADVRSLWVDGPSYLAKT